MGYIIISFNIMSQNYDYILDINLALLSNFSTMNSFFNTRSYTINLSGNSVNLEVNKVLINSVLSYDYYKGRQPGVINFDVNSLNYATLSPINSKFGFRMLEIIATKIFGNPQDLVLIENGIKLYQTGDNSIISQIGDNIQNNFNNTDVQNTVLNIYKNSNSFIISPGTWDFNFVNSAWQFPLFYTDTLNFEDGTTTNNFNGPNQGGSCFVNGYINIPILLKFYGPSIIPPVLLLKAINYSGSGPWNDESNNGNDATLEIGTIAKNVIGNGIILDGSTAWTFPNLNLGNNWSVSVWFKTPSLSYNTSPASIITQGIQNETRNFYIDCNDDISFISGFLSNGQSLSLNTQIQKELWYNIQITFDESTFTVYNNSVIDQYYPNATFSSIDSGLQYYIGVGVFNNNTYYITGEIGEVRIYNYAISQEQVTADYNESKSTYMLNPTDIAGCLMWLDGADPLNTGIQPSTSAIVTTWVDKSGNNNNGTGVDNPIFVAGGGVQLNGSSQYYSTPYTSQPSTENVFVVVKFNNVTGNQDILGTSSSSGGPREFQIINSVISLVKYNISYLNTGSATISANTIFMYDYSYTSSNLSAYYNGNLDSQVSNPVAFDGFGTTNIGYSPISFMDGTVYEIIIYNNVLTTVERQSVENYLVSKWGLQNSSLSPVLLLKAINYSGEGSWNDESGTSNSASLLTGSNAKNTQGNGIILDGATAWGFPALVSISLFTCSVWFKWFGINTYPKCIISKGNNLDSTLFIQVNYNNNSFVGGFLNNGTRVIGSEITIIPEVWYNIQITWDGSNILTYVNSVLFGVVQGQDLLTPNNYEQYIIGADITGEIGEVRIYNYAISQIQVTADYNESVSTFTTYTSPVLLLKAINYSGEGTWDDESGNGINATLETGTIAKNPASNGIILDGATAWTFPNLNLGNNWSVSVWFKTPSLSYNTSPASIITQGIQNETRNFYIDCNDDISFISGFLSNGQSLSLNTQIQKELWYNIQITFDESTFTVYNNSVIDQYYPNATFSSIDSGLQYYIGVGVFNNNTYYITGEIGEVRIYNYAISQEQVTADYNESVSTFP